MSWPSALILAACVWFAAINLVAFMAFARDKRLSVEQARRVPEWKLLKLVAWGGEFGALAAMTLYRHKTRKQPFQRNFWGIVAGHAGLAFAALLAWIALHK